jgi:hypothetical protein
VGDLSVVSNFDGLMFRYVEGPMTSAEGSRRWA